jgi:uncharacterized repeat protein (TIGR01451 family)
VFTFTGEPQGPSSSDFAPSGSDGAITVEYIGVQGTLYGPIGTPPTAAGTYEAVATLAADANHLGATSAPLSFTINPAASSITANPLAPTVFIFTGAPQGPSGSDFVPSGSDGAITVEYIGVQGTLYGPIGIPPTAAGTYEAVATLAADANHLGATSAPLSFIINPAASSIAANPLAPTVFTFTGASQGPSSSDFAPSGSDGAITVEYIGVQGTLYGPIGIPPTAAGTYEAVATLAADANHLGASSAPLSFTINPAASSITAVGGAATVFTFTGEPQGPSSSDFAPSGSDGAITVEYIGVQGTLYGPIGIPPTDAGTYQAVATLAADANHLTATSTPLLFTIAPKLMSSLLIDAVPNQVFSGVPIEPLVNVGDGNVTLRLGFDYTLSYLNNVAVGDATIVVGGVGNYASSVVVPFEIVPAAPFELVLLTQPVGGASGGVLLVQPLLEVRDFGGNRVVNAEGDVTASLVAGDNGVLDGGLVVPIVQGQASFVSVSLAGEVGVDYQLAFNVADLPPSLSAALRVTPGALAGFEIRGGNGDVLATQIAGSPFDLRLRALDAQGNVVTSFASGVTITAEGGLLGSPLRSAAFVAGELAVESVTLTTVGLASVTVAGGDPLVTSTSAPFVLLAGSPEGTQSSLVATPSEGLVADGVAAATLTVLVQDTFGNPVPGVDVEFALAGGTGGVLTGAPWFTAADGRVSASLTSTVANVLSVTASLASVGDFGLVTVDFVPGAPAELALLASPLGGASGGALAVQPVVEIRDAFANRVVDSSGSVRVALVSGGVELLGGTLEVAAIAGVATFGDLTLAGVVGTGYVLRFEMDGLISVDSPPLTLTPGDASGFSDLMVTPLTAPLLADGRSLVQLELVLRDLQGNRLDRGGDSVVFTSDLGTLSAVTDAGDGSYAALLTAGVIAGVGRIGVLVNGVESPDSATVTFIEATAEMLLEVGVRRVGDATAPFGVLTTVWPGEVLEFRVSFVNNGTDAASNVLIAMDLPLAFVLVDAPDRDEVWVVCPSLPVVGEVPEAIVSAGRLLTESAGLRLRVFIDGVCDRSSFPPGEFGWVTFRVEVR